MIGLTALLLLQPLATGHQATLPIMGITSAVGGTQAPALPPPLPACLGGYLVLFEWASDDLSAQAQAVLDNAASTYRICPQAQVMLTGHADRSGSDQYNLGLSQRRVAKVRAYLAGRGIPDRAMTTEALGESLPRVETADGDREPENRRVEIIFELRSGR
ncbi:MAG TPA: OmpA family protein [Allosphingosinicella sp.]